MIRSTRIILVLVFIFVSGYYMRSIIAEDLKKKTLYLNIIWHQHQPLYLDPGSDQLQGPWVRTHATKDYYDMVSIIEKYPDIHFTVNLTSSLLFQLKEYYIERLRPFLNLKTNRIDAKKYFRKYGGRTDPWIDLALKPTSEFSEKDLQYLLFNRWNAFGISDVMIERFPAYAELRRKLRSEDNKFSEQELRELKFWFFIAHFDPDFFEDRVELPTGLSINLTDIIQKNEDGAYALKKIISEDDCNRIVAEAVKLMEAIIPVHRKHMYDPEKQTGQIEVITTPFYHPILPLLIDSDIAKICQPNDEMPARFHYPEDADAQVSKSVSYYRQLFGAHPIGMWPAEGSVSHEIVPILQNHNIRWIATDEKVLSRSKPEHLPKYYPYAVGEGDNPIVVVFRDTELSDKIGFTYQTWNGEDAADDFMQHVLRYAPDENEPDRLLTVILDGENAWEWYRHDNDAKDFLNSLYRKLTNLHHNRQVITVTPTEYINGNLTREIPPHPVEAMPKLEWLWPGSWINANYDTWIGEHEENKAWEYLRVAREDLGASGIKPPPHDEKIPQKNTKKWYALKAWEAMYAATGSDWFWWYGTDQTAPAGDKPFDVAFITHLNNIYRFARLAGGKIPKRTFSPIIRTSEHAKRHSQGTMAQSVSDLVKVIFQCDAREQYVRKSIFIAGNHDVLGSWQPNYVRMHDDGTSGDQQAGDGIWTLELYLPPGAIIEYKFTNSGAHGVWNPSEEFPNLNRRIVIDKKPGETMMLIDKFGTL